MEMYLFGWILKRNVFNIVMLKHHCCGYYDDAVWEFYVFEFVIVNV